MVSFNWTRSLLTHEKRDVTKKQETETRAGMVNLEGKKHPRFLCDFPIEYYLIDSPSRSLNNSGRVVGAPSPTHGS